MRYIPVNIFIGGVWLDEVRYGGGDKYEYLMEENTSTVEELDDIVTELGYKMKKIKYSYFKDVKRTHRVDVGEENSVEDFLRVAKRRGKKEAFLFIEGCSDNEDEGDGSSDDDDDDDTEGIADVGAKMGIGESDEEEEDEIGFRVGQTFDSRDCFKAAIFKYAVAHKMDIKLCRSEKKKVHACCRSDGCNWSLYGSKNSCSELWTVRSYQNTLCS